jgi:hypothetical protein
LVAIQDIMKISRLHFYLMRLKNASLLELAFRAGRAAFHAYIKMAFLRSKTFLMPPLFDVHTTNQLLMPALCIESDDGIIDEILKGRIFTLNENSSDIAAFHDSLKNTLSTRISSTGHGMDMRAVWEPARLQPLTILMSWFMLNRKDTRRDKAMTFIRDEVLGWIDGNPFLRGPHYMCAMECGLRIPVFFYCITFLNNLTEETSTKIMDALYRHTWWVSRNLSLHSSTGNHTICECIGLIFGGAVFRSREEGRKWLTLGINLLKKELDHQILDDGGPLEQSFSYLRFILDLGWLAIDFLEINSLCECSDMKTRLALGEEFIASFMDACGNLPAIGDCDDGHALAPGVAPSRFTPAANPSGCIVYAQSGYSVLRMNRSCVITFDHGPLGMSPLFNHGHADALSITLSCNNKPLLVDPGTYRYNGIPLWRNYFRGTRAHNTVSVDDCDQAAQETAFIWSREYAARLIEVSDKGPDRTIAAHHDGYARLKKQVWHKRVIETREETCIVIKDTFLGRGVHGYEINFHLHPDTKVGQEGRWWIIEHDGEKIAICLHGEDDFRLVQGSELPLLGWYSTAYGIIRPSKVLTCQKKGSPQDVSFHTTIRLYSSPQKDITSSVSEASC